MIRTLLATTALAAILAVPVVAQDASSSASSALDSTMSSMESSADSAASSAADSAMSSSEMMSSSDMMSSSEMMSSEASSVVSSEAPLDTTMSSVEPRAPFDIVTGYTQIPSDMLATRIIGQPVYDSTAADANLLGNINDIVLDENGEAIAVTIGVGGFLGIGEKQVAVAFSALTKQTAADDTLRYVLPTTVEELTAAPEFVVVEDTAVGGTVSTDGGAAPMEGDAMATSSVAK